MKSALLAMANCHPTARLRNTTLANTLVCSQIFLPSVFINEVSAASAESGSTIAAEGSHEGNVGEAPRDSSSSHSSPHLICCFTFNQRREQQPKEGTKCQNPLSGKRDNERPSNESALGMWTEAQDGQNIAEIERVVSSILGGTLLLGGLARRSLPGLAIAATGAAFLYRGATGHCKVYESLGLDTYRNSLNSDRSEGLQHETARPEDSPEEEQPPSKPRRRHIPKKMTGRKGTSKPATVSSFSQK